jgi:hypothetical protein
VHLTIQNTSIEYGIHPAPLPDPYSLFPNPCSLFPIP